MVGGSVFAGTGDTVAVMITEAYGKDILAHLDRNLTVLVSVVFKTTKNSRGSLVFVSISFIVLMIISSAWLIFYFIQKIRYTSSHDRSQVTADKLLTLLSYSWHGSQLPNIKCGSPFKTA